MGMMGGGGGGRAALTGASKTMEDGVLAGDAAGKLSLRGLPPGGTWSIETNAYFEIDPDTGVITASVDNVPVDTYTLQVTYTVTVAGVTFTVSTDVVIVVQGGLVTITGSPTQATVGTPYSFDFSNSGPTVLTAGEAELTTYGFSYDGVTGVLSGTPL